MLLSMNKFSESVNIILYFTTDCLIDTNTDTLFYELLNNVVFLQ